MIYNSLRKVNGHLEEVGQIIGIGRIYIIKDVIIPQVKDTLLEMFAYFFVLYDNNLCGGRDCHQMVGSSYWTEIDTFKELKNFDKTYDV